MGNPPQYYDIALLSEAAYVNLTILDFKNMPKDELEAELKDALKNADFNGEFTEEQAEYFVNNWEVVSYQGNTETGFAATLFKSKIRGQYT